MPIERVMERRGVYEAREWDGSQEFLDWLEEHGGMGGSPFSVGEDDELYQWGAFLLPQGTWVIYRGGWWDILPNGDVYAEKYEVAPPIEVPELPA